jgi:AcrR family transcriptional regulator
MNTINSDYSKITENKQIKKENLLSSAYNLFIRKGVQSTSIDEITENAGVAKGTFYLYFEDKWDIFEKVIIERSHLLFEEALMDVSNKNIKDFKDKVISIVNYIIDAFIQNNELLKFIGKNLSLGVYNKVILDEYESQYSNIKETLEKEYREYNKKEKNVEIKLFMIIELTSSTIYNSILNNFPLPIGEYKPILFDQIRNIIK